MPRYEATLEACQLRLRPIMMTSFAFILGVVPLMLSEGAGAEMRRTLGTAVFSGMLGVTLFGIFLTPVFYYVIQWVSDRRAQAIERNKLREKLRRSAGMHGHQSQTVRQWPPPVGPWWQRLRGQRGRNSIREDEEPVTTEV